MSHNDPRNARARADHEASGKLRYDNRPDEMNALRERAAAALAAIDECLHAEFPVGCIVRVEDLFNAGRVIRGPVVGHSKSHDLYSASLRVRNEQTGTVRKVSAGSFIYREV